MPQYYFDVRNGDRFFIDHDGHELADLACVREEVTKTLGEMARDASRGTACGLSNKQKMVIEVRDSAGPVLEAKLTFEIG